MRCDCCNILLSDYEATLKSAQTNEFLNTCLKCLEGLNIDTIGRTDLSAFDFSSEEEEYEAQYVQDFLEDE
mgnify:CR=1 FL=1